MNNAKSDKGNGLRKIIIILLLLLPISVSAVSLIGTVAIKYSNENNIITFIGQCEGEESALVVCEDNGICAIDSPSVRCISEFNEEQRKSCTYTPTFQESEVNDNDIATCCTRENQCDTNTALVEPWSIKQLAVKTSERSLEEGLGAFPENFRLRKEGKQVFPMNTTIIIGKEAPSEDVLAALELSTRLGVILNKRVSSVLEDEVTEAILNENNLIIIGNSSTNKHITEISEQELPSYVAKVIFVQQNNKKIILIIGQDSSYRRKTAFALSHPEEYGFSGQEKCITGNEKVLEDIEIVDCSTAANLPDPSLIEQSNTELKSVEETLLSDTTTNEIFLPQEAECFDYTQRSFNCTQLVQEQDRKFASLTTSKDHEAFIETILPLPASEGRLFLTVVFQASSAIHQALPIYYRDGEVLKEICIIKPEGGRKMETQTCEVKNYHRDPLYLRLEGISIKGDSNIQIDALLLNHTKLIEPILPRVYQTITRKLRGTIPVNETETILFKGECSGENTKLMVCNYGAVCSSLNKEEILCESEVTNESVKECKYSLEAGVIELSSDFIGSCCTFDGMCDANTVSLTQYDLSQENRNETYKTYQGKYFTRNFTNLYPGTESFSVAAWVKLDASNDGVILSTGEQIPIERYWALSSVIAGENRSLIAVRLNSGEGEFSGQNTKNLLDGKWHHIIFIRDRFTGKVRIYVDGVFEGDFSDPTTNIFDVSTMLQIGSGNIEQHDWFGGYISDISIFPLAISESEIIENYNLTYRE